MLVVLTETYCNKVNIQITQRDDFIPVVLYFVSFNFCLIYIYIYRYIYIFFFIGDPAGGLPLQGQLSPYV